MSSYKDWRLNGEWVTDHNYVSGDMSCVALSAGAGGGGGVELVLRERAAVGAPCEGQCRGQCTSSQRLHEECSVGPVGLEQKGSQRGGPDHLHAPEHGTESSNYLALLNRLHSR